MISRRIAQLAAVICLTLACRTGATLAPMPPGALPICVGAETWDIGGFRLDL